MGHREDLLAGARQCLMERGYARTTARDLVAVSGTNLASIGYHFGSKEALLNIAMGQLFQEWAERVRDLVMAAGPIDGPEAALVATWDAIHTSCIEYRGLAVAFTEALAQAQRQPQLRAQLAETYRHTRDQVARIITEVVPMTESQAQALASFQIALCDGVLVQYLLTPEDIPPRAELADALGALLTHTA